jgi:hypothetical protein
LSNLQYNSGSGKPEPDHKMKIPALVWLEPEVILKILQYNVYLCEEKYKYLSKYFKYVQDKTFFLVYLLGKV